MKSFAPRLALGLCLLVCLGDRGTPDLSAATSTARALDALRAVGPEGQGNPQASAAWQQLAAGDAKSLTAILEAMNGANPLALNWLRSAVDAIASRELSAGRKLPVADLEKFLKRTTENPRARRFAYELIVRSEPDRAARLISRMLDDPSTELRRDAVQNLMSEAKALQDARKTSEAAARYQVAIKAARDVDQVESIAKSLKELGQPVQLAQLFGWLSQWQVVGPFDSTGGVGFDKVFPPEEKIDLQAEYEGQSGKVRWQPLVITNDYGLVDLNKPLGSLKGVAGYAYTEIEAHKARTVELRLGCKNAWKIWLNGKLLFGRDEYHRGMEIDQYRLKADLKRGKNQLLVKLCQNEQKEDWTKEWEFQLRITDDLGTPLTFARR